MNTENSRLKLSAMFAIVMMALVPLSGCDRDEGGMEEAAESVDQSMNDFGNAVEDKCEEAKEGAGASDTDC